jgi:hypothetical protein
VLWKQLWPMERYAKRAHLETVVIGDLVTSNGSPIGENVFGSAVIGVPCYMFSSVIFNESRNVLALGQVFMWAYQRAVWANSSL